MPFAATFFTNFFFLFFFFLKFFVGFFLRGLANEAFEKVASYGLLPNMVLYLIQDYHLGVAKATNILFLWSAATNFLPVVGAFLSDSYLSRFLTIGLGSITSLLVISQIFFSFLPQFLQHLLLLFFLILILLIISSRH